MQQEITTIIDLKTFSGNSQIVGLCTTVSSNPVDNTNVNDIFSNLIQEKVFKLLENDVVIKEEMKINSELDAAYETIFNILNKSLLRINSNRNVEETIQASLLCMTLYGRCAHVCRIDNGSIYKIENSKIVKLIGNINANIDFSQAKHGELFPSKCLGISEKLNCEVLHFPLQSDCVLVMCPYKFTSKVNNLEIKDAITTSNKFNSNKMLIRLFCIARLKKIIGTVGLAVIKILCSGNKAATCDISCGVETFSKKIFLFPRIKKTALICSAAMLMFVIVVYAASVFLNISILSPSNYTYKSSLSKTNYEHTSKSPLERGLRGMSRNVLQMKTNKNLREKYQKQKNKESAGQTTLSVGEIKPKDLHFNIKISPSSLTEELQDGRNKIKHKTLEIKKQQTVPAGLAKNISKVKSPNRSSLPMKFPSHFPHSNNNFSKTIEESELIKDVVRDFGPVNLKEKNGDNETFLNTGEISIIQANSQRQLLKSKVRDTEDNSTFLEHKPEKQKSRLPSFLVKTNVSECNILIFKGSALVKTAHSGQRIDLPSGIYDIEVSKEGFEPAADKIDIYEDFQIFDVNLKKK